jgi:predicted dehydrogenase
MIGELNVGIVGVQFMGRAHSNAYVDVAKYFELPVTPVMRVACDVDTEALSVFSKRWGWQTTETSWENMIQRDDVDLIDICTPNILHAKVAIAAARSGKHLICEKPIAMNAAEAQQMLDAAQEADVRHMVAFNYRRVPAIALAKRLIEEGKIGRIYHFNAVYYQDWLVDPNFPMVWRHDIKEGGSGAHGDMNAHTVDLARYLVGDIAAVCGDSQIFVKERPYANGQGMGKVTADDATNFLAKFHNDALGNFLCTRFGTGRKNFLRLEIFGSEGSLAWNLERLNELDYYSRNDDSLEQGYRNISVTEGGHPYLDKWWPPGHIIGWEHTFIHEIGDMMQAVVDKKPVYPDFNDGLKREVSCLDLF